MDSRFGFLLVLLTICVSAPRALAATPNPIAEAAVREGKNSYNARDYESAILAFKRAYAIQPDNEVLYQLGKAYAMGDCPVEAVEAFERYLSAASPNLSIKRKLEIGEAIEGQRRRIGSLVLEITPNDAKVVLDETVLDRNARVKPVPARQGSHVLTASFDGYQSQTQAVQVRGRRTEAVKLTLVPVQPPTFDGLLEIRCRLPNVSVLLDAHQMATTPLDGPILVPEGMRHLRLERTGYRAQTTMVQIARNRTTAIDCDLPVSEPLEPSGKLELEFPQTGAVVLIDGTVATRSKVLPPGMHSVEVRHYGFESWSRELQVEADRVNRVNVLLTPTPAYQYGVEQRARDRRTWSYVLGATGIAIAGTALGVGLWNHGRYADWQRKRAELEQAYRASGPGALTDAELEPKRNDANSQLRSIHAVDVVTAILGATGGMLLGSGTLLYVTTEATQRQQTSSTLLRYVPQGVGMNVAW